MNRATPLATALGILPHTPEETVLRLLLELGTRVVGADEGSLLVHEPGADELVFAMTVGGPDSERALLGQRLPLGHGITGLAAASGEVQIGAPTFKDLDYAHRAEGRKGEPEVVIAAPMLIDTELLGVITAVAFSEGKRFTQRDGELMMCCAAVAAVVVEQGRQLKAFRTAAAPGADGAALRGEAEELDFGIAETVARLLAGGLARRKRVAALLQAVEALGQDR